MKTTARKIVKLFFALLIPATIMLGCQEDIMQPSADGTPEKGKLKPV